MPESTESAAATTRGSESTQRLSLLLSVVAGTVDLTGFLTLGKLFTAHVTGNLVMLAADIGHDAKLRTSQLLVVPAFILACGLASTFARYCAARGSTAVATLLRVQLMLLACLFLFCVLTEPTKHPDGVAASIAAVLAVSAMGSQFVLVRSALPGFPSTASMTVNLTDTVLLLIDAASAPKPSPLDVRTRLGHSARTVGAFLGGCLLAAVAVKWMADLAWCLPLLAAAVTLIIHERTE